MRNSTKYQAVVTLIKTEKVIYKTIAPPFDNNQWLLAQEQKPDESPSRIGVDEFKAKVKKYSDQADIPPCNEVMVGILPATVVGLLTPRNTLRSRLNALTKQQFIVQYLKKEVPILMITSEGEMQEYAFSHQQDDIMHVIRNRKKLVQEYAFICQNISFEFTLSDLSASNVLYTNILCRQDFLFMTTSFLTKNELSKLALLSKKMRMMTQTNYYWDAQAVAKDDIDIMNYSEKHHLFQGTTQIERKETTEKKFERVSQARVTFKPEIRAMCKQQPELATKIMSSKTFVEKLPPSEKKIKRPNFLSRLTGVIFHTFLALIVSIFLSSLYWLKALVVLLAVTPGAGFIPIMMDIDTSIPRIFLTATLILPLIAMIGSILLGAYNGFKYGLSNSGNLLNGLRVLHKELFTGDDLIGGGIDAWMCYTRSYSRIAKPHLFKDSLQTINSGETVAAIADETEKRKPPSLLFKPAPAIISQRTPPDEQKNSRNPLDYLSVLTI